MCESLGGMTCNAQPCLLLLRGHDEQNMILSQALEKTMQPRDMGTHGLLWGSTELFISLIRGTLKGMSVIPMFQRSLECEVKAEQLLKAPGLASPLHVANKRSYLQQAGRQRLTAQAVL